MAHNEENIEQKGTSNDDIPVFDLSTELSQPTPLPKHLQEDTPIDDDENVSTPADESIDQKDEFPEIEFEEAEIIEDENQDEPKGKYSDFDASFLDPATLSQLIASFHHSLLPPLLIGGYKQLFFRQGEFQRIEKIIKKAQKKEAKGENYNFDKEELALKVKYNKYCDYRDNKAELSDEQINRIQKAWEWQLRQWKLDNLNLDVHPLMQAYGGLAVEKGADVVVDKVADKMR